LLQEVKADIDKLIETAAQIVEDEEKEKPIRDLNLNRVFIGNPGTGRN
jgi:hypothetical protein